MTREKHIFIGTSGFNYWYWKGMFYPKEVPQKDWLAYYSTKFTTVEINATFYTSFSSKVIQKWYDSVPSNFRFSIKGSRLVTHIKRLQVTDKEVDDFFTQLAPLQEKLGCVLWQFPASFTKTEENYERLEKFFAMLPTNMQQVMEFRSSSWFVEEVFVLLNAKGYGFVINSAKSMPFFEKVTGGVAYIRFHGPEKLYDSSYSEAVLREWAEKIALYSQNFDVYCYFNNTSHGYALENVKTIQEFLHENFLTTN